MYYLPRGSLFRSPALIWICAALDLVFFSDFDLKENILSGILKKKKNEFLEWIITQVSIESFHARVPSLEQIFIKEVGQ